MYPVLHSESLTDSVTSVVAALTNVEKDKLWKDGIKEGYLLEALAPGYFVLFLGCFNFTSHTVIQSNSRMNV